MSARHALFAALLSAALPLTAFACGVCIEDKVAATYDHAVVTQATRDRHAVLFFEITGLASQAAPSSQWLVGTVEATRGVARGSVRVSLEQAALSFAVNGSGQSATGVRRAVEQRLAPRHLGLKLLRMFDQGKLSAPS